MKKLPALFYALACITITSCMHKDDDISITYKDADDYYTMNADFNKSETRNLEEYMDKKIGNRSNISFANTESDATLTLDDQTKFYIKKVPGHIEIKLDKDENSSASYRRIKSMCEGMKRILTHSTH